MRIVLATPLYPPDIAEPAPYIKELARHLSREHEVTIATYGWFVEPVPGVRIVTVDKRHPLPIRLLRFFFALARLARRADIFYIENGPSVELPGVIASLLTGKRFVFHLGDKDAHARVERQTLLRSLERLVRKRAWRVIEQSPVARPEIIPFLPHPTAEQAAYERSWDTHVAKVDEIIRTHA